MRIALATVAAFLAIPAFAQGQMHEVQMYEVQDDVVLPGFDITVDMADDLDVITTDGRKIGEVEEAVGPARDTPEALVIDFEDGLPDYGREGRVVPLTAFTFDGKAMVIANGLDVSVMPVWRD